jgi:hypothetical protein
VVDGVSGLLVDDVDEMAAAVARLLADETARRAMGAAASRHAATFDWAASVSAFSAVLARSLRNPPSGDVRDDATDRVLLAALDGLAAGTAGKPTDQRSRHLVPSAAPRRFAPSELT